LVVGATVTGTSRARFIGGTNLITAHRRGEGGGWGQSEIKLEIRSRNGKN
jgi:hypothetical protein